MNTNEKKQMEYDDVLKAYSSAFKDKPVIIAFMDKNNQPNMHIGKFQIKDLIFMKHLIQKQIDSIVEKNIKFQ